MSAIFKGKTVVSKVNSPVQPTGVTANNTNVILVAEDGEQLALTGGINTVNAWITGAQQRLAQAQTELANLQGLVTFLQS